MAELPFDALAAVLAARVRKRTIPAQTFTPPPTDDDPHPEPYTVPAHDVLEADPTELPEVMVRPDGRVSLTQQVALLQDAVRRIRDIRLRSVHGSAELPTGGLGAGRDVPILWDAAPLAPVEAAVARLDVGVAWQGRVSARVKDGSITAAGCTVTLTTTGTVVVTAGQPLTVHADGLYNYLPPDEGEA